MKQIIIISLAQAAIFLALAGCVSAPATPDLAPAVKVPATQTGVTATSAVAAATLTAPTAAAPKPAASATPTPPAEATRPPAPTPPAGAATPQHSREAEEYAVYSAVIQTRYIDVQKPTLIVIRDQTGLSYFPGDQGEFVKSIRQGLPDLTDGVYADFGAQNKQPRALKPLFTISVNQVFISQQEFETTFMRQDGWDIFYAKYPKSQGHMRLSSVGFNPQLDLALMYVGNMRGPLAGEGFYLLLKKVDGKWRVEGQTMVWIS